MVENQIVSILTKKDFISKLIDIGYIDGELFLNSFSEDLWSFAEAIKYYVNLENYDLHST
jgi:hypothetical protein